MVTELKEDWKKVLEKERIAVVKCWASWCGPCKFFAPHFQRFSENLEVYNGVPIKYYQSNNDVLVDLKREYNIEILPSTLFLIHGVLVVKIHGVTRQTVIEQTLTRTLKIPYHITKRIDNDNT